MYETFLYSVGKSFKSNNVSVLQTTQLFCIRPRQWSTLFLLIVINKTVMLLDDLPEELVRKVFGYFTDAEVYFKLRFINRKIKEYVENYVELGKTIQK